MKLTLLKSGLPLDWVGHTALGQVSSLLRADMAVRASLLNLPKESLPPLDRVYDYRIVREVNAELDARNWVPEP